ncbi:TB2/DP1, HVA22 family [Cooperia oncophora]
MNDKIFYRYNNEIIEEISILKRKQSVKPATEEIEENASGFPRLSVAENLQDDGKDSGTVPYRERYTVCFQAIRTKDVREYVKWMMYWIVFAMYTLIEALADIFISFWFPFYYQLKIVFVLWLLSPWTKGASILYRKVCSPRLLNRLFFLLIFVLYFCL